VKCSLNPHLFTNNDIDTGATTPVFFYFLEVTMPHSKLKAGEVAGTYHVTSPVTETDIITLAKRFARRKLAKGRKISQPSQAFKHLQLLLQDYEHEVFSVLLLDSQHRVNRFE
tara:strand:+ start:4293 stop:4631 length:339 start_codon:yes stop_codon:yes gene_type:complete